MDMEAKSERATFEPIGSALLQPGIIWSCWCGDGTCEEGALALDHVLPPDGAAFRWVHLDLWDRRSQRWVEREAGLPDEIVALFLDNDEHPQTLTEQGVIGLVLPDFERDFDSVETGRLGALRVALRPGLLVTGRHRPLITPDRIRRRLTAEGALDAAGALDLVLDSISDMIAERTQMLLTELLALEDQFLADEETPDTRALVSMRRLSARLHRIAIGIRTVLHRLETDRTLAQPLRDVAVAAGQRLLMLEREIIGAQGQLRLLREELDLQAGQRTNENVYLLSIVTALFVPATLVTGFFGMNTGGMPFERGAAGTMLAAVATLACSGLTWLILRRLGLVRR